MRIEEIIASEIQPGGQIEHFAILFRGRSALYYPGQLPIEATVNVLTGAE